MSKQAIHTLFLVSTIAVIVFGIVPAFYSVFAPTLEMRDVSEGGIRGTAVLGPQCPVVRVDTAEECADRPYVGIFHIVTHSGRVVDEFSTGEDGMFAVFISPGNYFIERVSGEPFPIMPAVPVSVSKGVWTEIVLQLDSGIR